MLYKNLQNGSDIRGVALANEFDEPITLTPQAVADLASGFASFLKTKHSKTHLRIALGHDSRISAPLLKQAMMERLQACGVSVLDCGLASTPAMFMATQFESFACDGAMMITASHLPYHRNGIKFFDHIGGMQSSEIAEIIRLANEPDTPTTGGNIVSADLMGRYSHHLRTLIQNQIQHPTHFETPLTGMHILVDAGNGAGGFYADQVLAPLGATITGSQFLDPDGTFPNHIPNPEDATAMASISQAVRTHHADLGLIFDTDVDRSAAVDHQGREIARNALIALSATLVQESNPDATIVTDSVTSDELSEFIEAHLHMHHRRFKRGYKNVINEAQRLTQAGINAPLAIETSGHAAFRENYFLDDGAYLATKIVIKAAQLFHQGQRIDTLIAALQHPLDQVELRFPIVSDDIAACGSQVLQDLFALKMDGYEVVQDNVEGVRIKIQQANLAGWVLLRKSLHDPLLALNMETKQGKGCVKLANALLPFFERYAFLNLAQLHAYITANQ